MALRVHLEEANPVIEQLFVLGVSVQETARNSGTRIADIFEAHAARVVQLALDFGDRQWHKARILA